ncbi:hypothetical protein [Chryseobacterium populi]|uniref:Uncharacterized protein n=1 Tax=Chryseobacterium populi TaxID=1144316 RepID=J3CM42_9FLAO|nr:hypothetical protein [Chryseobacterium populi]EJL74414.1 hypothetical protein PMI13_01153 [Chryseobacterium populi]
MLSNYPGFKENSLTVSADNSLYDSYEIPFTSVVEIWKYSLGTLPEGYKKQSSVDTMSIKDMYLELKKDIKQLNTKLK